MLRTSLVKRTGTSSGSPDDPRVDWMLGDSEHMARRAKATTPKIRAKLFAFTMFVQQFLLWTYHMGSYCANPIMLRTNKPLLMRDLFLTKCTAPIANPLSVFYVPETWDMMWNTTTAWLLGMSVTPVVGFGRMFSCFFLGGFVSSMAYLFQAQLNPKRLQTLHDCNASSNGGWCAVAALGMMVPAHPHFTRMPAMFFRVRHHTYCALYLTQAVLSEYFPPLRDWHPNYWDSHLFEVAKEQHAQSRASRQDLPRITNWGCIGGIFFGCMFGRFAMGLRADKRAVSGLFKSLQMK